MTIETTRFGALEIDPEKVITLPKGLIGFPSAQHFVLLDHQPGAPFQWLQSVDDPSLAFVVVNPHAFFPDYEVEIGEDEAALIGIQAPEDARILTTVTVRRPSHEITTNLLGPLVVGIPSCRAAQLVLNGDRYSTRQPLPSRDQNAARPTDKRTLQAA